MPEMYLPDQLNIDGLWVKYVGSGKSRKYTRVGKLWYGVVNRCRSTTKGIASYNGFSDFQSFASWCQTQKGYSENPYFELDKDLLSKKSRIYSADTCLFLPKAINIFVNYHVYNRGRYPPGVNKHEKSGLYRVSCYPSGTDFKKHIGYFKNPEDAFLAYKYRKELIAKSLANKWKSKIDSRAYELLNNFEVNIFD